MGVRFCAALAAVQMVALALCASASASVACPGDTTQPAIATVETAMALACDVNVFRRQHGLRPLHWDWRLRAGAQRMADDMAARHYASHVTPEGVRLAGRIRPTGYIPAGSWTWLLAENLGWGTNVLSPPLAIALGWMDSDGHRANMLDPVMRDIGVGMSIGAISDGGQSGAVYVADFGTRGTADSVRARGRAGRSRRR